MSASRRIEKIAQHLLPSSNESGVMGNNVSGNKALRELVIRSQENPITAKPAIQGAEGIKAVVGKEIGVSDWLLITQERVDAFADATGDFQWIHIDPERAKAESPFGGPIAHGFLTISLAPFFLNEVMPKIEGIKAGINYGFNKLRFVSPVPIGSRLRCRITIQEVTEPTPGILQSILKLTFEVEGKDKPSAVAEWIVRYYV
eukprot:TRINITY_DN3873_c0_g1_i1.p1 TRINITY_DN3873_c0_g1~~TRINITY_DN3873_c0_g1_i1.p1  ORF type:complete len:202 (-),score=45.58 TRINITY_DN3873_c0_g1_i1:63-668(-)